MTLLSNLSGPTEPAKEQVRQWIESPISFWEECRRKYGDLVALELGSLGTVVLVSDPQMVKEIFKLRAESFEIEHYNEHYRYVMGGRSLLLSDGDTHARRRRLMMPPFRRDQILSDFATVRDLATRFSLSWPGEEPFNPRPPFHDFTFHVMVQRLFADLDSQFSRALIALYHATVLSQVGSWGPWQGFRRMQTSIRELLAPEIESRRADPDLPGILTHIVNGTDADGVPIDVAEIEDHVFTLFIAGVDTTAISLTWALYWLSTAPPVQERLHAELAEAGNEVDAVGLLRLPYLNAVFSETRRMFPVVPSPSGRRLTEPLKIGEYEFPASVTLVPCTHLVHRRDDLYPEPDRFYPERFLNRTYSRHEFFPSGGGNRTCIGDILTQFEFKIMLAQIMRSWRLEPIEPGPVTPVRHGTFLTPPEGFTVTAHSRGTTWEPNPKSE